MEECDDLVAEVEELLGLMVKGLPVLLQRSQVLAETCDAEYRFAAKGGEMRMPLDIGVALREHRFNVAAVRASYIRLATAMWSADILQVSLCGLAPAHHGGCRANRCTQKPGREASHAPSR